MKRAQRLLLSLLLLLGLWLSNDLGMPTVGYAYAAVPTVTYTSASEEGEQVIAPDWSHVTFSNLPAIDSPGWLQLPPQTVAQVGYNPSRSWTAGENPSQFLMLGDVQDAFQLEQFSLDNLSQITSTSNSETPLSQLGLAFWQTPTSLVKAIGSLGQMPLEQVKPLSDLLASLGSDGSGLTVANAIANFPQFALSPLSHLNLNSYPLTSIPNLTKTPLGNFYQWQQSFIAQVPGLAQVPFSQFPQPPGVGVGTVAIADVVWGTAEHGDPTVSANNFVSGTGGPHDASTQVVPCTAGKPCSYLELSDPTGANGQLHGKRWASGQTQQVRGGYGVLAKVNNGWEPTGRLVYGEAFKVVMTGANESSGTAQFGLYFRACVHGLVDLGCTPYFIGSVPWLPVREKGLVILASAEIPHLSIPDSIQNQINQITHQYAPEPSTPCVGSTTASGTAVARALAMAPATDRQGAETAIPLIIGAAQQYGISNPAQIAYLLATAQTETDFTTLNEGSTRYQSSGGTPYYGRGYDQLTGLANYQKASQQFGVDLVHHPDLAATPELSAKILAWGMSTGQWTGKNLNTYINSQGDNFIGARQIVNDGDKAYQTAQSAQNYLQALQGETIDSSRDSTCTVASDSNGNGNNIGASSPPEKINASIFQAAKSMYGDNTSSGPDGGREACAWEVNRVLAKAGIRPIGDNAVVDVKQALLAGRGQEISLTQAQPGDIDLVVGAGGSQHIGICMTAGCTQVLSNSSSNHTYTYIDAPSFPQSYRGLTPQVFRVLT